MIKTYREFITEIFDRPLPFDPVEVSRQYGKYNFVLPGSEATVDVYFDRRLFYATDEDHPMYALSPVSVNDLKGELDEIRRSMRQKANATEDNLITILPQIDAQVFKGLERIIAEIDDNYGPLKTDYMPESMQLLNNTIQGYHEDLNHVLWHLGVFDGIVLYGTWFYGAWEHLPQTLLQSIWKNFVRVKRIPIDPDSVFIAQDESSTLNHPKTQSTPEAADAIREFFTRPHKGLSKIDTASLYKPFSEMGFDIRKRLYSSKFVKEIMIKRSLGFWQTAPQSFFISLFSKFREELEDEVLYEYEVTFTRDKSFVKVVNAQGQGLSQTDSMVLFSTIMATVLHFCQHTKPDILVFAGNTPEKHRLYRVIIENRQMKKRFADLGYTTTPDHEDDRHIIFRSAGPNVETILDKLGMN